MKLFVLLFLVLSLSACISINTLEGLKANSTASPVYVSKSNFAELKLNVYEYLSQCYRSQASKVKMNGAALGGAIYSIDKLKKEDGIDFVVKRWLSGGAARDSGYHHFLLLSIKEGIDTNNKPTIQVHSNGFINTEATFENIKKVTQGKAAKC